jgi:hypothetical protein
MGCWKRSKIRENLILPEPARFGNRRKSLYGEIARALFRYKQGNRLVYSLTLMLSLGRATGGLSASVLTQSTGVVGHAVRILWYGTARLSSPKSGVSPVRPLSHDAALTTIYATGWPPRTRSLRRPDPHLGLSQPHILLCCSTWNGQHGTRGPFPDRFQMRCSTWNRRMRHSHS